MQLFSRNKAIVALSLGALALGACGDDVTVPLAPITPITLSITPPSANMNVGEAVNFAVQISGGPTTGGPTLASCTTSSATVATAVIAGSSCRVTAVAAGNATITAAASTGQVAAASVSVSAPPAAITSLSVSPTSANPGVGQTVTLSPTVQPSGRTATFTYTSSSATIASVTAAGVVTAVAPGVATITVTANGTGAGFSPATIAQAVTITVADRAAGLTTLTVQPSSVSLATGATQPLTSSVQGPRAAAVTYTYLSSAPAIATVSATGVVTAVSAGTAVIGVTASSTESGAFAASAITALVPVTVTPNAQVVINSLSQGLAPIDIANVVGQFEVNLALQPNGQNVSSVQAWLCETGETIAQCTTSPRAPAAQQTFGAQGGPAGTVQLYINSAEFATPDFTTGADANTLYKNGLKTIVATLTTAAGSPAASNNLSSINFNNRDGFTISWTLPTNKANDAAGNTWYGGPDNTGTGSFTVVPVIYTLGRTIANVTLAPAAGNACGASLIDATRPFRATYGVLARDTAAMAFDCTAVATTLAGHAPLVISSIDNANAAGPSVALTAGASIFNPIGLTSATATRYYQSLAYRSTSVFVPADWQAPVITGLSVRGGGGASVDSGWVNGAYAFNEVGTTLLPRYVITDNANGVGLFATAQRNTVFSVCPVPAPIPTTVAVLCATPVASGGLTATVASMNLPENATNLTNQAYFLVAQETDRLGNRVVSNPFAFGLIAATDVRVVFGVDRTAPAIVTIPAPTATVTSVTGFVRAGIDSIFQLGFNSVNDANDVIGAGTAVFAVRTSDERSGFASCTAGVNCFGAGGEFNLGTFQIVRRSAPLSPLSTNAASVASMNSTVATSVGFGAFATVMNGVAAPDVSQRQFTVSIAGDAARNPVAFAPASATTQAGYYTFSATLTDRAGNSTTTAITKNAAIDNAAPTLNNVILPATFTGGATAAVTLQASDDLEIMGAELTLGFPSLGGAIRFPRVTSFASTIRTGLYHGPFASLTDNLLATPTGAGQLYTGAANLPIPFIQDLKIAAGGTPAAIGASIKPNTISARVFDIRAMASFTGANNVAPTTWNPLTSSPSTTLAIAPNQVSTPVLDKNWGTDVAGNQGAQIGNWVISSAGTTLLPTVEFRATAITSSASVPFTSVYIVTRAQTEGAYGEYLYRGTATFAGTVDNGGTRFFRYTASAAQLGALAQGANVSYAAFGGLDSLRAIGVDAAGNALATDALIPGTTTPPNVISGISVFAVHLSDGVNPITSTPGVGGLPPYTITATPALDLNVWRVRNNGIPTLIIQTTPLSVAGDARVFVRNAGANATARVWLAITQPAGATPASALITTISCTSSNADIVVVSAGWALPVGLPVISSTVPRPYCDVRGGTAGIATLTYAVAQAASAPYAASTLLNTLNTQILYTGADNIAAVAAPSAVAPVAGPTTGTTVAVISIAPPTFNAPADINNSTMQYTASFGSATARYAGIAIGAAVVNPLTGAATVTVTCTTATATINLGDAGVINIPIQIIGRATNLFGYPNPRAATSVNVTCN